MRRVRCREAARRLVLLLSVPGATSAALRACKSALKSKTSFHTFSFALRAVRGYHQLSSWKKSTTVVTS